MRIVILDGYTENPGDLSWEGFSALGELTLYDRTAPEDVAARIGDADIVILNKTPLTRQTLEKCQNIRYIGVLATGYNIVDVAAAKEQGIVVCNIPTYGTTAVAQMTIALLLEMCHHVGEHNRAVQEGQWVNTPDWCFWNYPLVELYGKTLGIIGFGRIGQCVAGIAQALGMDILVYDTYENKALENAQLKYAAFDTLLAKADVISLHCPLFPETQGIINRQSIAKMKDGAMLINTSRGPLIVEEDLAQALKSGKLSFAAVDVVSSEPIKSDNPLLGIDNMIITPHIAWAPKQSRQRLMDVAVDNLRAFLNASPVNVVNP